MSASQNDQVFPRRAAQKIEHSVAEQIAAALREDYGEYHSAVKLIGRRTGANPRAIRNWYEAKNAPTSGHLLLLARSSPNILQLVLRQIGGDDLVDGFQHSKRLTRSDITSANSHLPAGVYGDNLVTINVTLPKPEMVDLNHRQLWFVGELQNSRNVSVQVMAAMWQVTVRTIRRDIAQLVERRFIRYVGSTKRGYYVLTKDKLFN